LLLRFDWCLLLLLLLLMMMTMMMMIVAAAVILYRLRMAAAHCTGLYCVIASIYLLLWLARGSARGLR
jgi:hypothetical protein